MRNHREPIRDVYAIPVGGTFVLYSPLHGIVAELNRAALDWLFGTGGPSVTSRELLELKASLGSVPTPPQASAEFAPSVLGIIPTRGCNLSCVYCDFGSDAAQAGRVLPLESARTAVDWFCKHLVNRHERQMKVHFFGGEPLVAFDRVREIVEHCQSAATANGLALEFELTTNGHSDERVLHWVGQHIDTVVLSLDGPREFHDWQRPMQVADRSLGTFDRVVVAARILGESRSRLQMRCCVTSASVTRLDEIVAWFCQAFSIAGIGIEPMKSTPQAIRAGVTPPDPLTFARAFYAARAIASTHGIPCGFSSIEATAPRGTLCPVGADGVILDVDGSIGSCYLPRSRREQRLNTEFGRVGPGGVEFDAAAARSLKEIVGASLAAVAASAAGRVLAGVMSRLPGLVALAATTTSAG